MFRDGGEAPEGFPLVGDFKLDGMCVVGDAGPGPSCLISYTPEDDKGFFGEVPANDMHPITSLSTVLGITQGINQNVTTPWLKFWLDGRILYVTKKTIKHSISWDHLNDSKAVDGTTVINYRSHSFRIGLMSGIDHDYKGVVMRGFNQPYTMRSEWTRLMYNVASDEGIASDRRKQGQAGENWAAYPQDNSASGLGITGSSGRDNWTRNLNPTNSSQAVSRGNNSVARLDVISRTASLTDSDWRPMLELIKT